MRKSLIVTLTLVALVSFGCKEKEKPITSGRVMSKTHYLAGETRECKRGFPGWGECKLGEPEKFPERCVFDIEEWETKRRGEVEVPCDQKFENTNVGDSWSKETK